MQECIQYFQCQCDAHGFSVNTQETIQCKSSMGQGVYTRPHSRSHSVDARHCEGLMWQMSPQLIMQLYACRLFITTNPFEIPELRITSSNSVYESVNVVVTHIKKEFDQVLFSVKHEICPRQSINASIWYMQTLKTNIRIIARENQRTILHGGHRGQATFQEIKRIRNASPIN